jgi:hypothetical protein
MDRLNPLIVAVLRSRCHWLASAGLMAITITGRRSGRVYTIPVGYHDLGDVIMVLSSNARQRSWWRNFQEPRSALLRVRGRELQVEGLALAPDSDEYRRRVEACFSRARFIPGIFGIDFDRSRGLSPEQLADLADYAAVVRFEPARGGGDAPRPIAARSRDHQAATRPGSSGGPGGPPAGTPSRDSNSSTDRK